MRIKIYLLALILVSDVACASEYYTADELSWIPVEFLSRLSAAECLIPKLVVSKKGGARASESIIVGQFAKSEQYDIAVVCESKNSSYVYIHWGGRWGGGRGCSGWPINGGKSLFVADIEYLSLNIKQFRANGLAGNYHEGIGVVLQDQSLVIRLCQDGQWLTFPADEKK